MHSFDPNCTLPPEGTNFVGSAPIRGTLQILWSSLSVLILCTWTLLHLNIPPQTTAKTKWQKLRRSATRILSKFGWMLFNVLAPEWVFTKAVLDWISVYQLKARFVEQAQTDGVPWTDTHTQFANMGGFGISFQDLIQEGQRHDADTEPIIASSSQEEAISLPASDEPDYTILQNPKWRDWARSIDSSTTRHYASEALSITKGIFSRSIPRTQALAIDPHNSSLIFSLSKNLDRSRNSDDMLMDLLLLRANLWILDAAQLLEVRKLGIISSLPNVEEDDLEDRSNNNVFIKLLAVGQTSWFILQFLVRFHNGQPNTQLEVMVVAFAVCSIVTYIFLWNRPKEVEYTVFLKAEKYASTGLDMAKIAGAGPLYWSRNARRSIWISNSQMHQIHTFGSMEVLDISVTIVCTIMLVFGAIHCVAWNFDFPTRVEQIMWQASSLISILAPLLSNAMVYIIPSGNGTKSGFLGFLYNCFETSGLMFTFAVSPLLFIAARLFILVEVFRTLVFQPSGTFETTWLSYIPHFG